MEIQYLVAVAALLLLVLFWRSRSRKLPPGPWGLPIVGYLPFLTAQPYLELQRLAKKYGNVFSVRLGSFFTIVLNDYQSTKDAFSRDVFIARPLEFNFRTTEETKRSGAFHGPLWKEQRRFSLHTLRDLGFGKTQMEAHLQEEIAELLSHFALESGQPFSPRPLLSSSMSNNVAALVLGKRYKYDDPVRKMMNDFVDDVVGNADQASWKQFVPWLKNFLVSLGIGQVGRVGQAEQNARKFIWEEIEEHEKTLDPDNIRDYIDGYLLECRKRGNHSGFNKHVLLDLAYAFFTAGSETVRISIEWLLLLSAQYQEHQRRLQDEIDNVVGKARTPTWQDQREMPQTTAFIMEMQRWRTLVPVNLLRLTLADTELNGYFIPKHTMIISNLWAVHHDPEYWGPDADDFRPERFFAEDSSTLKKLDHYIPFSIGKRSCPGEPLANIEVFLYFTSILQRFKVSLPAGKEADFSPELGATLRPPVQDIILTNRDN